MFPNLTTLREFALLAGSPKIICDRTCISVIPSLSLDTSTIFNPKERA
jgi:hypothetical protein